MKAEPQIKVSENVRNLQLMVNARCDEVEIQSNLENIKFKPTMM